METNATIENNNILKWAFCLKVNSYDDSILEELLAMDETLANKTYNDLEWMKVQRNDENYVIIFSDEHGNQRRQLQWEMIEAIQLKYGFASIRPYGNLPQEVVDEAI